MVKRLAFAVPGNLDTPTGGYIYDRRIIAGLRQLGWHVEFLDLGEGFPRPGAAACASALDRISVIARSQPVVIDGLAYGVLPELVDRARVGYPLIALVHHPLALESGLSVGDAEAFLASERTALAGAHHVIVTSAATARLLTRDYEVAPNHMTVVRPGVDRVPPARGSGGSILSLLAVGAVVPRKGYDVLIAALRTMTDLSWRLTVVGDRSRDPLTVAALEADVVRHGLGDRVWFVGAVSAERLAALHSATDLFALPSRFEGYGMAFAEAISYGLPIVGTTAGAIPDTVPPAAGILVPPDDVAALAAALRRLIEDRTELGRLAAGACTMAQRLPSWESAAKLFSQTVVRFL